MNAGIVQNFLALGDPQEARALLEGLRSQLGHLFQLTSAGEGSILLPEGDDVFGGGARSEERRVG